MTETTFLILLTLYTPNHGYGIMQFIEWATEGRVVLGAGTLYGAMNTLAKKKWIVPLDDEADSKRKRYVISDIGKQKAEAELRRMSQVWKLAATIIGGGGNEWGKQ